MGLCNSKASAGGEGGYTKLVSDGIKGYVMNLVVQRATGGSGDSQMGFLTNLLKNKIPGAKITEQIVPNASPDLFNISSGGSLVHSSEQSGPVQSNADSIVSKLTQLAKENATAAL